MQIWKSAYIIRLHVNINMPKFLRYNIFYISRDAHVRYVKWETIEYVEN